MYSSGNTRSSASFGVRRRQCKRPQNVRRLRVQLSKRKIDTIFGLCRELCNLVQNQNTLLGGLVGARLTSTGWYVPKTSEHTSFTALFFRKSDAMLRKSTSNDCKTSDDPEEDISQPFLYSEHKWQSPRVRYLRLEGCRWHLTRVRGRKARNREKILFWS